MNQYLKETYFLDYTHPTIQKMIAEFKPLTDTQDQIAQLYLKVRDAWRYNPYRISTVKESYRASTIASGKEGHCIDKSILFVAGLRGLGIPARLHLAKVANHIAVERLVEKLGSNEIAPHGIVDVYFEGKWVKSSTAFNKELCNHFNVAPLEFDGTQDSIFQEFNSDNHRFMEYLEDYGYFEDVPFDFILETFRAQYPKIYLTHKGKEAFTI